MKENKKSKKSKVLKGVVISLISAGALYLAYKNCPKIKGLVDGILPVKKAPEIKTKPFRKYEYLTKKK